jgi:hypothetical protein
MKSPSIALCLLFSVALTLPASLHAASTTFPTGAAPRGVAFDGANVWVANSNRNTDKSHVAMVAATPPSIASSIGVGGLSLIGLLALRRRVRGFQG